MYLGFVPAFASGVHECQRFCEHRESCLWLSHSAMGFGKERQKIRSCDLCTCGTIGYQALVHLLDPCLRLPLVHERPAAYNSTFRRQVRKTLFLRKADEGFVILLGSTPLAAELMDHGSKVQGITQTIGVYNVLR